MHISFHIISFALLFKYSDSQINIVSTIYGFTQGMGGILVLLMKEVYCTQYPFIDLGQLVPNSTKSNNEEVAMGLHIS